MPKNRTKNSPRPVVEEPYIKDFLDMVAPSVIDFKVDHYLCGNTCRCVWALREYPTSTSEQAILRYLGEKDGVTLRIYTRPVTAAEERRIIANAANKNRMQRNSTNDLQQTVAAESNLQDVAQLAADMHRNREPLLHVAVFLDGAGALKIKRRPFNAPSAARLYERNAERKKYVSRAVRTRSPRFLRR